MHTKFYTHDLKQRRLSIFRAARGDAMLQNIAMFLGKKDERISLVFCPAGESVRRWKSMGRRFRSNADRDQSGSDFYLVAAKFPFSRINSVAPDFVCALVSVVRIT